jgi:hypothetical protein
MVLHAAIVHSAQRGLGEMRGCAVSNALHDLLGQMRERTAARPANPDTLFKALCKVR